MNLWGKTGWPKIRGIWALKTGKPWWIPWRSLKRLKAIRMIRDLPFKIQPSVSIGVTRMKKSSLTTSARSQIQIRRTMSMWSIRRGAAEAVIETCSHFCTMQWDPWLSLAPLSEATFNHHCHSNSKWILLMALSNSEHPLRTVIRAKWRLCHQRIQRLTGVASSAVVYETRSSHEWALESKR